eukprot:14601339-Ditylum_brightwellii.AAC.1
MENVLHGIKDTDVYLDNVGVFSDNWESHIKLIDEILHRQCGNRFTINSVKCETPIKVTNWLGYWLPPHGLKPWKRKLTLSSEWICHTMPLNYA